MLFKPLQEKKSDCNASGDSFIHQTQRNHESATNHNENRKLARGLFGDSASPSKEINTSGLKSDSQSNNDSELSRFFQKFNSQSHASMGFKTRSLFPEKDMIEEKEIENGDEMDIESAETNDKENKQTNNFDYKVPAISDSPFIGKQGLLAGANGKPEEFARPARRKNSLIQMWKKGDPIFAGKFSTGATPKIQKEEFIAPILSNLSLKRMKFRYKMNAKSIVLNKGANSDIPPTLENGLQFVDNRDQHFGNNKYVNHAKKIDRTPFPNKDEAPYRYNATPQTYQQPTTTTTIDFGLFKTTKPSQFTHVASDSSRNMKQQGRSGAAFARNLFGDDSFEETGRSELSRQLFSIPESNRNSEGDLDQVSMKIENDRKRISARKFDMDESFNRDDDEGENDGQQISSSRDISRKLFGEDDEEECQTPSKREAKMITDEDDFLHTLRGQKNRMDIITSSASTNANSSNHSSMEFTSFGSFNKTQQKKRENMPYSRFKADYEDLEILGSGHFGTVYKCLNKIDGLMYAIKTIKYKKKGVSHINQALNEVQALASLSAMDENPSIVRYYNVWMEEDMVYLVMEYCPSNLRNIEGLHIKFSESMIRQVLRDVCMGLKQLHKQKIVHLDIKPENILYSRTHKYKIADLGLSRIAERQAGEDINEGDSRYLAPELLSDYSENLPDLTKADIFSLGVTIYELMTGQEMPKNGPEWRAIRSGHLPRLENLRDYSNSLKSIIKLMLSPNPDQRPSAQDLLENSLQSELELELRWEKAQNLQLKKKIKEYEQKLRIHRKNSF